VQPRLQPVQLESSRRQISYSSEPYVRCFGSRAPCNALLDHQTRNIRQSFQIQFQDLRP
jgi:hypothetical protein